MRVTSRQLDELVAPVRQSLAKAQSSVQSVGNADLRATQVRALATVAVAVDRWAVVHRQEVLEGKRTFEKWRDHGADLLGQLKQFNADLGSFAVQFSQLAENLGNAAQWVLAQRDKVLTQIDNLAKDLAKLDAERKRLEERRAVAQKSGAAMLSSEARELLFGKTSKNALGDYELFRKLVEGLVSVAAMVRGGRADFSASGQDFVAVPKTSAGVNGLGAVQIVAGAAATGAVLATIAKATAIAVSLWAFFRHLDERVRADVTKAEADVVKNGTPDQVAALLALKKLQLEGDKARTGGFGDQIAKAAKGVGIAVGIGSAVYGVYKLFTTAGGKKLLARAGLS